VTVKLTLALPAGTVTLGATCATLVMLLESITTAPPPGAAAVSVTVPTEEFPPATDVGFRVTLITAGVGTITSVVVPEKPFTMAVIVALVCDVTTVVVIEKFAVVAFCGTVTLAGTCAFETLLVRVTVRPAGGAAPVSVTVPVTICPPTTGATLKVILLKLINVAGVTVAIVVTEAVEDPCRLAVIVTCVRAVALPAVTGNVTLVAPAGIVALAGTGSAVVLLLIS
jgi:hypothetical protein